MKKLNLKKIKVATIGNPHLLKGGTNNSDANTYCNVTGAVSVTCATVCDVSCNNNTCNETCNETTPGATRANGSGRTVLNCLD